jgi:hypothetical protein
MVDEFIVERCLDILDEDRVGPVVLASMLGIAILVNFFVKLYQLSQ